MREAVTTAASILGLALVSVGAWGVSHSLGLASAGVFIVVISELKAHPPKPPAKDEPK